MLATCWLLAWYCSVTSSCSIAETAGLEAMSNCKFQLRYALRITSAIRLEVLTDCSAWPGSVTRAGWK